MGDYFDWRNINVGGRIIVSILAGLLVAPPFLFLLVYTFKGHPKSLVFLILLILTTTLIIGSIYLENIWQKICILLSYIFVIIFLAYIISLSGEDRRPIIYKLLIFISIALFVLTEWGKIFVDIRSIYGDNNIAKQIFSDCYSEIWEYIFYILILLFLAYLFAVSCFNIHTRINTFIPFLLLILLGGIIAIKIIFFCEEVTGETSIKCSDFDKDEEKCDNADEFCSDPNLSEEYCGTCSNSPDCEDEDCSQDLPTNKSDCIDAEKEWSSLMTDCYWNKPSNDSISACDIDVGTLDRLNESPVEEKCLTQITKCDDIDCNDFQLSNLFNDCCPVEDWKKNMDCDTLSSILEDDNIDTMEEALNAEYNLKKASSSKFQRRREMDAGLYE